MTVGRAEEVAITSEATNGPTDGSSAIFRFFEVESLLASFFALWLRMVLGTLSLILSGSKAEIDTGRSSGLGSGATKEGLAVGGAPELAETKVLLDEAATGGEAATGTSFVESA